MKVYKGHKYLLEWKHNPFYWNKNIKEIKKDPSITKEDNYYYTTVISHFTGNFSIVDCTCDIETGDFYPIQTELLYDDFDCPMNE